MGEKGPSGDPDRGLCLPPVLLSWAFHLPFTPGTAPRQRKELKQSWRTPVSQALCLMRRHYRLHFADEETKTSEMTSLVAITTVKRKIRPGTGQWHEGDTKSKS